VVAVAEASRDSSGRRGKIRCRPQIGFVRENLVRRVAPRSLQFSGPTFECRRRVPTSGGYRRWYLVPLDAGPDSREFPAPEMVAKGSASTHSGSVVPRVAIDVPRNFRCCARTRIVRLRLLPRVSVSPLKMRSPERIPLRARTRISVGFGNAREGNFVLPSWQIFFADVR